MKKIIAKTISGIFNPLLIPTYGLLILFNSETFYSLLPYEAKKLIFLSIFLSTCIIPLAFIPLFYFQKVINNFEMKTTRERYLPFAVIGILYFIAYMMLGRMGVPNTINNLVLAAAFIIVVILLISIKWKISAHMAGIGGLFGALIVFTFNMNTDFIPYIIATIFVAGLLGSSRMILKLHNPGQIYTGFGTGVVVLITTYLLF
jgi:hypothetical protein